MCIRDRVYPAGMRFSLAGITWETVAVNEKSKVIFVKRVPGISVVDWDVDFESELHTAVSYTHLPGEGPLI